MEPADDFNADPFFNDASLQQIDASGIDALNAVPLPSSPSVIERMLNLQACGCLNRIAWSRGGHIARIAEDGASVELHCLIFDPKSCSWALGLKHTEQLGLGELNSLAWSPAGSDLAVADIKGRLSILRPQNMALNRYLQVRSGLNDEPDELSQVIGMYWLPQDRPGQAVIHLGLRSLIQSLTTTENCCSACIKNRQQMDPSSCEDYATWPTIKEGCCTDRQERKTLCDLREVRKQL